MFKHHHLNLALFDIKVRSPHKGLILVKGNEFECDSIPFEGSVKLSISEDMHVKKIKLSLIGEYNIEFFERTTNGVVCDKVIERLCVLKVDWNNLLTEAEGNINFGDYGDTYISYSKLDTLKKSATKDGPSGDSRSSIHSTAHSALSSYERPSFLRAKSQPTLGITSSTLLKIPKSGIDGTPFKNGRTSAHHSYLLPKGNYNLPFKVYLPTNISETVEGLKCGQLLYRVDCTIEKGRFEKSFHKSKHIRIVRTLHPQNLNLIDSIDINNIWPGKVQYNVNLPKKGIAVGSTIPINVIIVPMIKGLTIKALNGVIVQRYHLVHPEGISPEFEETFGKQSLPIPDVNSLPLDKWIIKSHFKVPDNLKSLTQTCVLKNGIIRVKHRLRISIQLRNSDGHVSELRANLPVYIYISANCGHSIGNHFEIDPHHGYFVADQSKEDILFKKDMKNMTPSRPQSPLFSPVEDEDNEIDDNDMDREVSAPPLYQQHFFDKTYDLALSQSPIEQLNIQITANSSVNSLPNSMVNIAEYFDIRRNIDSSIENENNDPLVSPNVDLGTLSKVPSYEQAVEDDDNDGIQDELAPVYSSGDEAAFSCMSTASSNSVPKSNDDLPTHKHHRPLLSRGFSLGNIKFSRHTHSNSQLPSQYPDKPSSSS